MSPMLRNTTLAAAIVLLAATAQAAIEIEPARPTTADRVRITVSGNMPTPCYDVASSVTVEGGRIAIGVALQPRFVICIQMIGSWSVAHEVGPLPAGAYTVVVDVSEPTSVWASGRQEAAFAVDPAPGASAEAPCTGDCDGDGRVEVAELVTAVRITLSELDVGQCPAFFGVFDIAALVAAVEDALYGCGGEAVRACSLDPVHSGIDFGVGLRLPVAVIRAGFSGALALRTREPRGEDTPPALEGTIPVTVATRDLRIDPIRLPGLACLCIRAAEHAPFGPDVAGVGSIDCADAEGSAHLDLLLSQTVLNDEGVCETAGPDLAGGCPFADYGPDCLPCTDDDAGMSDSLLLALSTAPRLGAPFDCAALAADPNGGLSGGALAGAVPSPDGGATITFACR